MIHPQDFADFQAMSGNRPLPAGFEQEYEKWLRMQHRRKQGGPLGALMVPLCRQFNVEPPDNVITDGRHVDWRNVKRGQRVIVAIKEGEQTRNVGGVFRSMGDHGTVCVVVDGDTWVREYPPFTVTLDFDVPPDVKLSTLELGNIPQFDVDPGISGEGGVATKAAPAIKNPRLRNLLAGSKLLVELADDTVEATFVELGPNDGEITVTIDGEPDPLAVTEESVDIA